MKTLTATFVLTSLIASITSPTASAAAVFKPVHPDQVPAGLEYNVSLPTTDNSRLFAGKRVAILASQGVEELEITYPYQYLIQRGAQVDILVPEWTPQGIVASRYLKPTLFVQASGTFRSGSDQTYDLLVLTGGAWNAQVVRMDGDALHLVRQHYETNRPIAAICAGSSILINAGIAMGTRLTGSPAVRADLENAGATYVDHPMVRSDRLVTSRTPNDLPEFVKGIRVLLGEQK